MPNCLGKVLQTPPSYNCSRIFEYSEIVMAKSINSIAFESILKQQSIIRKNFNNMKNKGKVLNTDLLSCTSDIVDMNFKLIEVVKFLKTEQVGVKVKLDKTESYAETSVTVQDSSSSSPIVNLPDEY